jgi:hypothetical protein
MGDGSMSNNQLSLFDQEIWRWIKGYEGHYKVSNFGRLISLKYGKTRILKQAFDKKTGNGYKMVCLVKNGKQRSYKVHRLVAAAFLPACPGTHGTANNDWHIDHIDENKNNNCASNLRWLTSFENKMRSPHKLTEADIIAIRADPRSYTIICLDYGVSSSSISNVKNNRTWKHI